MPAGRVSENALLIDGDYSQSSPDATMEILRQVINECTLL